MSDPRVLDGMKTQLEVRAAALAAGSQHLGWKAGFGAPAALAGFELAGPLVGYMLQEAVVESGDSVSVVGWTQPVAEPEIAVHIGTNLSHGRDLGAVIAAITGLGPAIELADLDPPPADVGEILAGNIFHRRVILGPSVSAFAGGKTEGLIGRVNRSGTETTVTDVEANTGFLTDIVAHIANSLAACGEQLRPGDVIICGSVVPPMMLTTDDGEVRFQLAPVGEVSVRISHT